MKYINDNSFEINIILGMLHIIKYINIIELSNIKIKIKLNACNLTIYGNNLLIKKLDKYELLISGIFNKVEFDYE